MLACCWLTPPGLGLGAPSPKDAILSCLHIGIRLFLGGAFRAGGSVFDGGVIGEPAELLDRRLERLVIQALAEAFIAGGLGDLEGDEAADGAQFPQAGIKGVLAGRMARG